MKTMTEVKRAIRHLNAQEKAALAQWLNAQTQATLSNDEEPRLLRSLDAALCELDAGKGVPIEDAHKMVSAWVAK